MPRLRRVDCASPGIVRKRRGRGFTYQWEDGRTVIEPDVLARIHDLVLPPAWRDVWICPVANGHIQAVGTDAAGRRQYRYHDRWRVLRDRAKHDQVLLVARRLPRARAAVAEHLVLPGYPRERVLAAAFQLLDLGFFRIGSEQYADENGSYGLATIRREHVALNGGAVVFDYPAKNGKQRIQHLADEDLRAVVKGLLSRRDDQPELLAYKRGRRWTDVRSDDINAYLREVIGVDATAKDFRTWHATVLMAVALAVSREVADSPGKRRRAVARAYQEVAEYLGNTPAVARASYVDPRIVDLYDEGSTVLRALEQATRDGGEGPFLHGAVERAVLRLLTS
ncbi:MAG TPA: DNA topoisomerase IB [Jiangellaceae bacterium]|nr:DNA topoisomerase IB [Jiangellaceae bacterium]